MAPSKDEFDDDELPDFPTLPGDDEAAGAKESAADGDELPPEEYYGELDEDDAYLEQAAEGVDFTPATAPEAEEEEEAPVLKPVKEQPQPAAPRPGTRKHEAVKSLVAPISDYELFRQRKRSELSARDIGAKAICRIKHGLRQPGAQESGKPFIPEDWDTVFKPDLGSYVKFLLSRPDQFRVVEGAGPGLYTVQNVTGNRTVVAPSITEIQELKGKGKGKGKEKGKDGKGFKGKGKGKWGKDGKDGKGCKGKAPWKGAWEGKGTWDGQVAKRVVGPGGATAGVVPGEAPEAPVPVKREQATKAARLIAEVAKEQLEAEAEDAALAEDIQAEEEGDAQDEARTEQPAEEAEEEVPAQKAANHGSFIRSLLSGGLLGGGLGQKRPLAGGESAAKRKA